MNYKQGLLRIWLVFTILWGGYWGYVYISENQKLETLNSNVSFYYSEMDKIRNEQKTAPDSASGGVYKTKSYLSNKLDELSKKVDDLNVEKDEPYKNIDNAQLYGPIGPIILLISYFVVGWIRKGFKQGD